MNRSPCTRRPAVMRGARRFDHWAHCRGEGECGAWRCHPQGNLVTFWLSGGHAGDDTALDCTATTLAGRKITGSLNIVVVARM